MMDKDTIGARLESDSYQPIAAWNRLGSIMWAARAITGKVQSLFYRYVIFQGNRNAYFRHLGVRIGEHTKIQISSFGSEPWLVELGSEVTITTGVLFITHDGSSRVFRRLLPESSVYGNRFGTIRVFDNCFIGVNSIILPDVVIGPNSIVGAGSVVNKDVPPNTVAAGVPAKPICSLEEYIEKYKSKMLPISATNRQDLRKELTLKLWGGGPLDPFDS